MASNFRAHVYTNKETLYVRFMGDFDASSAFEMMEAIEAQYEQFEKIIIDTSGISSIYSYSKSTFERDFAPIDQFDKTAFIKRKIS
jgi:hypothetical protein